MKANKLRRFKTFQEHKAEALKNPEFKAAYEALEPEYQMAQLMIEARLAKKLTQEQLAKKAGVNQATIARLESGTNNPTIATVTRVASALGKELTIV